MPTQLRCKTAQLSSLHTARELSCAKLCCWVLFSYISGLLEDRAIIQSSLMRWSHSLQDSADVLKLDDDCPPFLSQHGLWRNSGAATRTWHVNKLTWRSLQSRYVYCLWNTNADLHKINSSRIWVQKTLPIQSCIKKSHMTRPTRAEHIISACCDGLEPQSSRSHPCILLVVWRWTVVMYHR